ncbi:MAG TPA: hypothetical protein PLG34_07635 [Spirochaetota bacterium]|nr:MAG: hypothetical protein BWX91_02272 [Spirochaetes bacterium ADurb.Bin133]HNZ27752.1 hypothetical protein [Spirochaetota bacterium]HPY87838.1 hypothetical protein [Spirochaetota bacterium]
MNFFKRIYLSYLLHQRDYDKILSKTAFKIGGNIDKIDPEILRFQGVSSFYKKNYYHSKMCYEILQEKKRANSKDLNYLAYMYARHNEKEKALLTWCKALDIDGSNKIAKKSLDYLKEKGRDINLSEDEYFEKILPGEPFYIPVRKIIVLIVLILVIGLAGYFSVIGGKYLYKIYKSKNIDKRTELEKIFLQDFNPQILESPKNELNKYSYSEKEIKDKFDRIKNRILEDDAVSAQININQIKMSNASPAVKMKMDILQDFINEPDYALFKNVVAYNDFIKEPNLYENVYIIWSGRVINKSIYKDRIAFDIVIGDETTGTIDAIIPAVFDKAVIIENNENIHLFGKIKFEDKKIYIEGKYVIRN